MDEETSFPLIEKIFEVSVYGVVLFVHLWFSTGWATVVYSLCTFIDLWWFTNRV